MTQIGQPDDCDVEAEMEHEFQDYLANREHINKCVNAHDDLVDALKWYADKSNYQGTPS